MTESRIGLLLAGLLSIFCLLGAVDLFLDGEKAWNSPHAYLEMAVILAGLGAAVFAGWGWTRSQRSLRRARVMIEESRSAFAEARSEVQKHLDGLGQSIAVQLSEWKLTPAEQETAFLLLKGLSHKEIAKVTHRSERTVRQHAVQVYRKSGLGGRAELSAYFLEDLLPSQRGAAC